MSRVSSPPVPLAKAKTQLEHQAIQLVASNHIKKRKDKMSLLTQTGIAMPPQYPSSKVNSPGAVNGKAFGLTG